MRKTFKYRLFPTRAQRTKLEHTLEICRTVYNKVLETRKNTWEQERKGLTRYETQRMLPIWKDEFPEFKEVHSQVLQNVNERVDFAFQAFFRRVKAGDKPGFPRFKGGGRYDSFTFPQGSPNGGFVLKEKLSLSKIGDIKINLSRPIEGAVKTLTIHRDGVGNFYACFSCVVEPTPLPVSFEMVGIDLGLTTFATLSNGETIERERWLEQDEKDLKRVQRKVNKLAKGSPERKKAIKVLNHVHARIKNRRNNFAHQESRKLINRYGLVVFEKLDIQGMQSSGYKSINRGILDVAWSQFVRFSLYKAEGAGRASLQVDPRGSSQECSGCHQFVPKALHIRIHHCQHCGLEISRDHNAAINILGRGLATLRSGPVKDLGFSQGNCQ